MLFVEVIDRKLSPWKSDIQKERTFVDFFHFPCINIEAKKKEKTKTNYQHISIHLRKCSAVAAAIASTAATEMYDKKCYRFAIVAINNCSNSNRSSNTMVGMPAHWSIVI